MDECIDSLGVTLFWTLDASSGYWPVEIAENHRNKNILTSHYCLFRFTGMHSGMQNAQEKFQQAMYVLLTKVRMQIGLVYLEDIFYFGERQMNVSTMFDNFSHYHTTEAEH